MALAMLGRMRRSLGVAIVSLTKAPNFPAFLGRDGLGDREPESQEQNRLGGQSRILEQEP